MATSSATQRSSTPKREHLLETAFQLFYRDGFHAVGIDRILAEAGLAKMTLYHHFKSKEALIVAALERRGGQIRAARAAAQAAAGPAPAARLRALFEAYGQWFGSPDFNGCGFIRAIAEYPEADSPVHQAAMAEKRELISTLERLLTELGRPAPAILAPQLYLLIEGAIVSAHTFGDPTAARHARDAALVLVGLDPVA